ncbi:MAG TPA: hypothetical protein DDY20_05675 [Desulfobulbaceae bacterium]|nr:hypothetical protein [Desulfobulbaceae bacterium]
MEFSSTAVALTRCADYHEQRLLQAFDRLWAACATSLSLRGTQVLLKPNLITARRGLLACTEGRFILAAAQWFLDQGSRVTVGDSPAFGTAEAVLESLGVAAALRGKGVRIVDFGRTRPVILPSGLRVGMAIEALDCDLLVNLPRVKAHAQMRVSMAVKNYFGCVGGMRKPLWHMVHGGKQGRFADHLAELLTVLPGGITLVDGITAMHRTGPTGGVPFPLRLSACSTNPVATDRALLEAIGVDPEACPLLQACRRAGLTGSESGQLHFPLLAPADLRAEGFIAPPELMPVRFNPLRFGKNSVRRLLIRLGAFS